MYVVPYTQNILLFVFCSVPRLSRAANKDVDLRKKYLVGMRVLEPIKKNIDHLNVFHHSAIRWILGIRMTQVKEERIKNMTIRKQFGNIQEVSVYIRRRTWSYIGKIIRANENLLPRQLTGAWIQAPEKSDTHRNHAETSLSQHLKKKYQRT